MTYNIERANKASLVFIIVSLSSITWFNTPASADASLDELKARLERAEKENILLKTQKIERENITMKHEKIEAENAALRNEAKVDKTPTASISAQKQATAPRNTPSPEAKLLAKKEQIKVSPPIAREHVAARREINQVSDNIPKDDTRREMTASYKASKEEISLLGKQSQGIYAGVNGGYGGGDFNFTQIGTIAGNSWIGGQDSYYRGGGAVAGGQIGYNYITNNNYFIGGEFDFNWAGIKSNIINSSNYASAVPSFPGNLSFRSGESYGVNWLSTTRVRLGYEIRGIIPYITGGMSFGDSFHQSNSKQTQIYGSNTSSYFNTIAQSGFGSGIKIGWVAGAGLEIPIHDNISVKTEYLYTQFPGPHYNSGSLTFSNYAVEQDVSYGNSSAVGIHQVRFGVNYHPHFFDQPAQSITTKY